MKIKFIWRLKDDDIFDILSLMKQTHAVIIRIPMTLKKQARSLAGADDLSLNQWVVRLIEEKCAR